MVPHDCARPRRRHPREIGSLPRHTPPCSAPQRPRPPRSICFAPSHRPAVRLPGAPLVRVRSVSGPSPVRRGPAPGRPGGADGVPMALPDTSVHLPDTSVTLPDDFALFAETALYYTPTFNPKQKYNGKMQLRNLGPLRGAGGPGGGLSLARPDGDAEQGVRVPQSAHGAAAGRPRPLRRRGPAGGPHAGGGGPGPGGAGRAAPHGGAQPLCRAQPPVHGRRPRGGAGGLPRAAAGRGAAAAGRLRPRRDGRRRRGARSLCAGRRLQHRLCLSLRLRSRPGAGFALAPGPPLGPCRAARPAPSLAAAGAAPLRLCLESGPGGLGQHVARTGSR